MEIFRKLEKEAADFEQKRREARRQASRPKQDSAAILLARNSLPLHYRNECVSRHAAD